MSDRQLPEQVSSLQVGLPGHGEACGVDACLTCWLEAEYEQLQKRIKAHTGRCYFCFDQERSCPDCGPLLTGMPDEAWKAEL